MIFSVLVGGIFAGIASAGGGVAALGGFVVGALLNSFVFAPAFYRLDVDYLQDVPDKTLVHTIPIVLSDPATKVEPAKST